MQGKRVLHLSATAFGGGVSEILYTLVPLMRDVGIDAHWQVILGREEFFNCTKLMHNSLQGAPEGLTDAQKETYDRYNHLNAMGMEGEWDVVIVHDPQPAADALLRAGEREEVGLALPHRSLDAEPGHARADPARTSPSTTRASGTSRATCRPR